MLGRGYCRCTAEGAGIGWRPRWGRDDAVNHLCDPILIGKAKPDESQLEGEETFVPMSSEERRKLTLQLSDKLLKHFHANPELADGPQTNKLLELASKIDEREEIDTKPKEVDQLTSEELRGRIVSSISKLPPPDFIEHLQQGYKHLVDVYIPAHRQKAAANDCEAMMRYVRKVIDSAP